MKEKIEWKHMMTCTEVAKELHLSPSTIRKAARTGHLKASSTRLDGKLTYLFTQEDVDAWLKSRENC